MKLKLKLIAPIVLLIAIWLILFFYGRYMLYLQEQLQLFQNDWHYILENCTYNAGFAQMAGEFITQFYHILWLGTLILALLLTGTVYILKGILIKLGTPKTLTPIAIIPIIPLIYTVITTEYTFSVMQYIIAIAISGLVFSLSCKYRYIIATIISPMLFWLCGAPAILLPIFTLIEAFTKKYSTRNILLNSIPLLVYIAFGYLGVRVGFIGSLNHFINHTLTKLPLKTLRDYEPMVMVGWCSTIVVALYGLLTKNINFEKRNWLNITYQVAIVVAVVGGILLTTDNKEYSKGTSFSEYNQWAKLHYLYTQGEYQELLNEYKTGKEVGIIESNYINLALYRQGTLLDNFFKYSPLGYTSLLTNWADAAFPNAFLWSEVCNEMGIIYKSQQSAFEGLMLSGPRGSSMFMKALVETEIMMGNYKTAEKYISTLENTIFYKDWATQQRSFLSDKAVERNDYYRVKRKCITEGKTLLALTDILELLKQNIYKNPEHKSSYNFAALMTLSSGVIPAFRDVISTGVISKNFMPPFHKVLQEGIVCAYNNLPVFWEFYKVDKNIQNQYREFVKALSMAKTNPMGANAIISKQQDRYWYYIETMKQKMAQQKPQNVTQGQTQTSPVN